MIENLETHIKGGSFWNMRFGKLSKDTAERFLRKKQTASCHQINANQKTEEKILDKMDKLKIAKKQTP